MRIHWAVLKRDPTKQIEFDIIKSHYNYCGRLDYAVYDHSGQPNGLGISDAKTQI